MRPPYHPRHVEKVIFPNSKATHVQATCSCGWHGAKHELNGPRPAPLLIVEFDTHRRTYAAATA